MGLRAIAGKAMRRLRGGGAASSGGGGGGAVTMNVVLFTMPWPSDALISATNSVVLAADIASSTVAGAGNWVEAGWVDAGWVD